MSNQDFYTEVKIRLLEKRMSIKRLWKQCDVPYTYNWFYQVLKGQRSSDETINKVKTILDLQ